MLPQVSFEAQEAILRWSQCTAGEEGFQLQEILYPIRDDSIPSRPLCLSSHIFRRASLPPREAWGNAEGWGGGKGRNFPIMHILPVTYLRVEVIKFKGEMLQLILIIETLYSWKGKEAAENFPSINFLKKVYDFSKLNK